jgi:cell division protein FtsI/penicillin-binding protein 2
VVLREDLSPEEFRRAAEVTAPSRHTGLAIESYFVRHRHPDPRIRRIIGEVTLENGMEVGISGKELTQDSFLRGRPGIYRVMTNPQGEWVPETWKKIQEIQPGYDVYLPLRIQP